MIQKQAYSSQAIKQQLEAPHKNRPESRSPGTYATADPRLMASLEVNDSSNFPRQASPAVGQSRLKHTPSLAKEEATNSGAFCNTHAHQRIQLKCQTKANPHTAHLMLREVSNDPKAKFISFLSEN